MDCVQVYLCSNPEDSVVERRFLKQRVFVRLREYCRHTYGVDFRVIDPYEAADPRNWPTQQERLQILKDCRKNSLGPFFVGIVGEQYGDLCVPEQIEASEFKCIFQMCQRMGLRTDVLEKFYEKDENAIPPSFCVLNPYGQAKQLGVQQDNPVDEEKWNKALPEMRRTLHNVVNQCVEEGTLTPDKAQKYFQSALEKDLRNAYEDQSSEDIARCLCYVHKLTIPRRENILTPEQQTHVYRLFQLRESFLPNMVASHKALVYCATTECNRLQAYTPEMRLNFAVGLCEQLNTDLNRLIDCALSKERTAAVNESNKKDLCCLFSALYRIKRAEVEHVRSYLMGKNTTYPFILKGRPCSGKTVLLAHCASQASIWLKDLDPEINVYFVDLNNSIRQLLTDICEMVDPGCVCVKNIFQLQEHFKRLLTSRNPSKNPLVIIIDGLDQLPKNDRQLNLTCLPESLAPNVKLLISVTSKKSGLLAGLKMHCPDSTLFCELQPVASKSCSQQLTTLLQESKRKISSGQQMYVNAALNNHSFPICVELLHRQAISWNSRFEITENTVVQEIHTNINLLFEHLEKNHGKLIISKALCYLTLARHGMTAAELTDVLSCDNEVLACFLPPGEGIPLSLRVPEIFVEVLLSDLRGFLVLRNSLGTQSLFWISRHFPLVVCKRYLYSEETGQKIHQVLSDYFSGSLANGTAKSLIINEEGKKISQKILIDRQVPTQPWKFSPSSYISTSMHPSARTYPNFRKLHTLPFHLLKSGRIEELGNEMISQEYLQAMLQAGLSDELFLWLERTSQLVFHRELQLLHIILRSSACLLRNSPYSLSTVLQARILPFLNVFPTLEKCVNPEGMIPKNEVRAVLPPVPSVPYSHCTLQDSTAFQIIQAAGSPHGTVVVVLENGAAWVCNGGISESTNLNKTANLHFTSVSSTGNTFLLSTKCGKLLLFDAGITAKPEEIQATEARGKTILKGVLASYEKILVWWRGQSTVSVYVGRVEYTQLHCSHDITCVSCSVDGSTIYCGQNEGSVTIFDWPSGKLLATFTCPNDQALNMMIVSEGDKAITCIDQVGNVFAWDLKIVEEPDLISELHCRTQGKVLNIDYQGGNVLLICKKQQMQLIDVHQDVLLDQFNPPRGKAFKQAIMDQNSYFVLALLCSCPFLLVWNCYSGQCVLSLDTANHQADTLLKCGGTFLAAVASASVLIWDMDLIRTSALSPKSGKKVEVIAVGSQGECCYSSDGSDLIWKWVVLSGKVEGHFLHDGSVESMSISGDGRCLVSIANGDIYVWDTSSGENTYRITGGQAYKVLVTPKGNSGVALSETGLSRVWKLQSGHGICSIHLHLREATISPESTFLLGLNRGNLLAVSLWSGNVSRSFSCYDLSDVVAYHSLLDHPDYTIVASALGALYSWRLTEDTVCHQFQLPDSSMCQPEIFQVSSDGKYAILSISESTMKILDLSNSKLCSLRTEGPVRERFDTVGVSGQYMVYICFSAVVCHNTSCDLHGRPMLVAVRLTDGETVGRVYLCKNPSTLSLSEDLLVYVGFEDGSVGVYAVNDTKIGNASWTSQNPTFLRPLDEQLIWSPLVQPNLTWVEFPL